MYIRPMRNALLLLLFASSLHGALPEKTFDVVEVAQGVHGVIWREPLQDPVEGNVLIIINEADVVLVDAPVMPGSAQRVVAAVRKLTTKPVRYVVNTHWHNDHVQSNDVYRDAWPGAEFISHHNTRTDAIEQAFGTIPKVRTQYTETIARLQRWKAAGKDDSGKPVDEARKGRIDNVVELLQHFLDETTNVRMVAPDVTLDRSLILHRGTRTIEVRHLGRGNTRGDVVVFLPKERIVATGDLVVNPTPFAFGSYYKEWIDTLGTLAELEVDAFFPGHGPVQRDRTYIEQLRGLLRTLTEQVGAAVAKGATLEETQKQVTLAEWQKVFAGTDETKNRAFEAFFVKPAVERAWRQAKGEPDKIAVDF
jgi:cyclase